MADIPTPFKVAEQQLDTAIELFFREKSSVSIHTLACAAHEILDKICEKNGIERGIVEQSLSQFIPVEKRKEVYDGIFAMKNYFKHGAFSRDVQPKWEPEVSMYFLIDACALHRRISNGQLTKNTAIFTIWFRMLNPELFTYGKEFDDLLAKLKDQLGSEKIDKQTFYETCIGLPIMGDFLN